MFWCIALTSCFNFIRFYSFLFVFIRFYSFFGFFGFNVLKLLINDHGWNVPCELVGVLLTNSAIHQDAKEGEESSENVFYTGAAPNQQAIPAVNYLMNDIGVERWVLAGTDYVYPRTTNKILETYLKAQGVAAEDIMINYTPFGHSNWQAIVSDIKAFGSAGKKTAVVSTINYDFIDAWVAYTGREDAVTNDPMEAHYIGFNMYVEAVRKAGTTDVNAVKDAIIGVAVPNLTGGIATMMPNHHITKPVLIGEIQDNGQFSVVWQTPSTVVGDAWSDFLPGSKDLISDWRKPMFCGNFNVVSGTCGGKAEVAAE